MAHFLHEQCKVHFNRGTMVSGWKLEENSDVRTFTADKFTWDKSTKTATADMNDLDIPLGQIPKEFKIVSKSRISSVEVYLQRYLWRGAGEDRECFGAQYVDERDHVTVKLFND